MAETTAAFLNKGTPHQFRFVLGLYQQALRLKAESKALRKPQEMINLDDWYQKKLPVLIKSRGKDPHINHDELIGLIKWKLARGKFRPRLKDLVTTNSPRVVVTESRKALRALFKKDDLGTATNYLCNLKGINPATASAILTAASPQKAAFMADEVLTAVPEIEGIDYTISEYLEMMKHIKQAVVRLSNGVPDSPDAMNCHEVELTLWTHNVLLQLKPELLLDIPKTDKNETPIVSSFTNGPNNLHLDEETNTSVISNDGPDSSSNPLGHFEEDSLGSTISTEGQQSNDSNGSGAPNGQAPVEVTPAAVEESTLNNNNDQKEELEETSITLPEISSTVLTSVSLAEQNGNGFHVEEPTKGIIPEEIHLNNHTEVEENHHTVIGEVVGGLVELVGAAAAATGKDIDEIDEPERKKAKVF